MVFVVPQKGGGQKSGERQNHLRDVRECGGLCFKDSADAEAEGEAMTKRNVNQSNVSFDDLAAPMDALLTELDLTACLRHIDSCRSCRVEIAKRRGLGWRLAQALIRKHGREAVEAAPIGLNEYNPGISKPLPRAEEELGGHE